MWMQFIFEAVLVVITGCFEILGNIIIIVWFLKLPKKLNFHHLMITLAFYDSIYIILSILVFAIPEFFESYTTEGYYHQVVPKALPIIQIALTGSIYCTGAISVERYLTVCLPFLTVRKKLSAIWYVAPIIIFSLLYNLSRFFELRTDTIEVADVSKTNNLTELGINEAISTTSRIAMEEYSNGTRFSLNGEEVLRDAIVNNSKETIGKRFRYVLELTDLRNNTYYYAIYTIGLNFVFMGIVPFAMIITLNSLMYKELMRILKDPNKPTNRSSSMISFESSLQGSVQGSSSLRSKRRVSTSRRIKASEIILAKVSLLVVAVFVLCHSIRWIPNIYELAQRLYCSDNNIAWPTWVDYLTNISHFLVILNGSVNFYIYYLTHKGLPSCICSGATENSTCIEMRPQKTSISKLERHPKTPYKTTK